MNCLNQVTNIIYNPLFQIIFEAVRGDGSTADIALDDVMMTTTSCGKG